VAIVVVSALVGVGIVVALRGGGQPIATPSFHSPSPRQSSPSPTRTGSGGGNGPVPSGAFKPTSTAVYKTVDGRSLTIAYFKPGSQTSNKPILCFSGSGWRSGAWEGASGMAAFFAEHGHPAFAVEVSGTADQQGVPGLQWPQMLNDAQDSVSWVRSHASNYAPLDTNHIALSGTSSGGHIALYAALKGTPGVVAVLNYSGPSDLVTLTQGDPATCPQVTGLLGSCTDTAAEQAASPINLVKSGLKIAVYLNGFQTDHVPFSQQQEMADRLKADGITFVLHESPGQGHGFNGRGDSGSPTLSFLSSDL
jgi:acetyl esterase/lipase